MRTVTYDEIQASMDSVGGMTHGETTEFMRRMQEEQPYILIYIAAICERGDFEDENDSDAFINLSGIVWQAMRCAAGGALAKVLGDEIDEHEAQMMGFFEYAEGEAEADWPAMVEAWMDGYNQRPLLELVLDALISPNNPYDVTDEGSGLIFTYLKIVIDCLDNADPERKP